MLYGGPRSIFRSQLAPPATHFCLCMYTCRSLSIFFFGYLSVWWLRGAQPSLLRFGRKLGEYAVRRAFGPYSGPASRPRQFSCPTRRRVYDSACPDTQAVELSSRDWSLSLAHSCMQSMRIAPHGRRIRSPVRHPVYPGRGRSRRTLCR